MRLIDANALKEHITEIFETEEKIDKKWAMGLKYSLKIIDNAPTIKGEILTEEAYSDLCLRASRESPQGEWVNKEKCLGEVRWHDFVCSVCGHSGEDDEGIFENWNFCPNCGADMRTES